VAENQSNLVTVGRIGSVYGIKGWFKVRSDTEPAENLFEYTPWWLKTRHGVKAFECDQFKPHGNGLIAHLVGIDDRSEAEALAPADIAIERDQLPQLDAGEFYWHQLIGLRVVSSFGDQPRDLGRVKELMETGANDVLVVAADDQSIDDRTRLVPYIPEQYVLEVSTAEGVIEVDWDPEF
jgi:16S rRNA processing protein RimM